MKRLALIVLAGATLAGCSTNTKGSWSCGAVGPGQTCSSIEGIDAGASSSSAGAFGGLRPVIPFQTLGTRFHVCSGSFGLPIDRPAAIRSRL